MWTKMGQKGKENPEQELKDSAKATLTLNIFLKIQKIMAM